MLNYIWGFMILASIVVAFFTGRIELVTKSILDSSKQAIDLCIGLLGIMCFWCGIMQIVQKSGALEGLSSFLRPLMKFLFPNLKKDSPALNAMMLNIMANFLGLGNAATPLGLKAMNELQKINYNKESATNEMCMFIILNTACIQLIPTTIIAIRTQAGSTNPTSIIAPIWIASFIAVTTGITLIKMCSFSTYKKKNSISYIKERRKVS